MTQVHAEDFSADEALPSILPISHARLAGEEASKTKVASFRFSARAHVIRKSKAAEAVIAIRPWLEQAILQHRIQTLARTKPHSELKPLLFQAGKAGNNLNQLAHRVHALRLEGKSTAQECASVLDQLQVIQATFREAVPSARAN